MTALRQAMIFAAGLGTRLQPYTLNRPKALVEVNGKSLLRRNVEYLYGYGIRRIVVNIHHFPEQMQEAINELKYDGLEILISDERDEVLETGGGLKKASHFFTPGPLAVVNVDILTDLNLSDMCQKHLSSGALATLAILQRQSSRGFLFDTDMRLCGWQNIATGEKKIVIDVNAEALNLFAFSGVHIADTSMLHMIPFEGKFSLVDVFLHLAADHLLLGYEHNGSKWIDVGRPESLERAGKMFV
jgi:N-acetyl-alpha-D-muramate 1-phosphate uridylyltransferase